MACLGPLGVEVIMQDCHSCDPGSIPGVGAYKLNSMYFERALVISDNIFSIIGIIAVFYAYFHSIISFFITG